MTDLNCRQCISLRADLSESCVGIGYTGISD
uniref:Uncharacterized protein n=1 Tax=Anguilla anguilla TaxID=7936 RepID=A0A0E9XTT3_ANGAN